MKLFAVFFILAAAVTAQTVNTDLKNLRTADGLSLSSPELPKFKLKFKKPFKYVGGHTFILYEVARAEQHFYVDADKNGNVSRLYWVQYENYLPSNTHTYDYSESKQVKIGGLDFAADSAPRKYDPADARPNSDRAKAIELLTAKGYKIASDDVMTQRLVNMTTPDNRNELMIIYLEVLTPTGFTAADLNKGGKAADKWPEIATGLLERATKGFEIVK
jgi:hypothetical protein